VNELILIIAVIALNCVFYREKLVWCG